MTNLEINSNMRNAKIGMMATYYLGNNLYNPEGNMNIRKYYKNSNDKS